jgi:hypothetical protein
LSNSSLFLPPTLPRPPSQHVRREGSVMHPMRVPQERSSEDCSSSGCMSLPSPGT